jgi:hypothetical protein
VAGFFIEKVEVSAAPEYWRRPGKIRQSGVRASRVALKGKSAIKPGFFRTFLRQLKAAFEWTVQYYLLTAMLLLIAGGCILVFLLIAERLGFIRALRQSFGADEEPKRAKKR